jgi:hypothetical protein
VTRADLAPPVQACQAIHAALAFAAIHHPVPPVLALLEAPDELALCWLLGDAHQQGLSAVPFHEPDLDDALTAVALGPSAARLCRKFSLCMRGGELDDHHD